MEARILCVGDMHLGRPVLVPESLAIDGGIDPAELRPAAAWKRSVDAAIETNVNAVVIAGDAVDLANRLYEALGPLTDGIGRLAKAGIPVYGVAGNHDAGTFPKLTARIDGFHLLGSGGQWEVAEIPETDVRLVGWSFPEQAVRRNPFDTFGTIEGLLGQSDGPVIGVLHGDRDVKDSRNAPFRSSDLVRNHVSAWILGHIHKPDDLASMVIPSGYLGSISGLDPTESGPRGPWMMEIDGRSVKMTHLPLAPLRWERVEIDVSELQHPDDLHGTIEDPLKVLHSSAGHTLGAARAVGCRLRLAGRTPLFRQLPGILANQNPVDQVRVIDGIPYFIESVILDGVRPAIDLTEIARGADPPAILAQMLIAVMDRTAEGCALIAEAHTKLAAECRADPWTLAGLSEIDDEASRDYLIRAGFSALDELLGQRGEHVSAKPATREAAVP